jgi:apolipoprotein N-acyltransferase
LAFPPLPLGPLALVAWLPLLAVLEVWRPTQRLRSARLKRYLRLLRYSYLSLLLWNLIGCYWLLFTGHGMDLSTQIQGIISGTLAIVLNPLLQAVPVLLFVFLRRRVPLAAALGLLAALFVTFEFIHFNWELTWSWLTLGHAFSMMPWYIQYLEYTGVLGASAFILLTNAALLVLSKTAVQAWQIPRAAWLGLAGWLLFPLMLYPLLTREGRSVYEAKGELMTRVVQPNIDPYGAKFGGLTPQAQLSRMDSLLSAGRHERIQLGILPETAIPRGVSEQNLLTNRYTQQLLQRCRRDSMDILTGIVTYRFYRDQPRAALPASAECNANYCHDNWNAAVLLQPQMPQQPKIYQKARLVPFSERTPYLEELTFLQRFNIDLGGSFGSYALPDSMVEFTTSQGYEITPAICYESIFGGYLRDQVADGASLICIITNDGWWNQTSGYLQHAAYARLRAIETRRAIARSANTGESSFIDPQGFMHQPTAWGTMATLDRRLPILTAQTFYVRHGSFLGKFCLIVSIASLLAVPVLGRGRAQAGAMGTKEEGRSNT